MEVRKVEFDTTYQPGEIELFDNKLRQTGGLQAAGSAELVDSTREIRVRGRVQGRIEGECDRCLETASFVLDQNFDLFYRPADGEVAAAEMKIDDGEAEIGYYEGGGLELESVLREQILLALPMQRVCSETCRGICPVCGQSRNTTSCDCRVEPADDRWSALRNI
jgi:uncharacterized protein